VPLAAGSRVRYDCACGTAPLSGRAVSRTGILMTGSRRIWPVHPLAMKTTFHRCFLVNFAVSPSALESRLPNHIQPDIHEGRGYVSVVIAEMRKVRPALLPEALGTTYNQVVYRAVVKCGSERGVAFLRSDADNRMMVAAGNALTFFKFNQARISICSNVGSVPVIGSTHG
jgi:uncharacterized protein YqjF (DUF2071 family)